jgi:hypothetical protein
MALFLFPLIADNKSVKYMTMLFTVNVETTAPPATFTLSNLDVGYGVQSELFDLSANEVQWPNDLPQESRSGREVIPGQAEMDLLIAMIKRLINIAPNRGIIPIYYRNFHWPGHVFADHLIQLKYTVTAIKPRLGCTDIDWLCEMKDSNDLTACSLTHRMRINT